MQGLLNWLKRTLADDAGNPSALRHLCVFVVIVPLSAWLGFCFYTGTWQPLDAALAALVGSVLGILGGRKAFESNGSTPEDKP